MDQSKEQNDLKTQVRTMFRAAQDTDEGMSFDRFRSVLKQLGSFQGVEEDTIDQMCAKADTNCNGVIDVDEFLDWVFGDTFQNEDDKARVRDALAEADLADGMYNIENVNAAGLKMAVAGVKETGANVFIWDNPKSAHTQWLISRKGGKGGGTYVIENVNALGQYLAVAEGGKSNGAKVIAWGTPDTQWRISRNGGGTYVIENVKAPGQYLAVAKGGKNKGTKVVTWDNPDNAGTQWQIAQAPVESDDPDTTIRLMEERRLAREERLAAEVKDLKESTASREICSLKKAIAEAEENNVAGAELEAAREALKEEKAKRAACKDSSRLTEEQAEKVLEVMKTGKELMWSWPDPPAGDGRDYTRTVGWVDGRQEFMKVDDPGHGDRRVGEVLAEWYLVEELMQGSISDPKSYAHQAAKWLG